MPTPDATPQPTVADMLASLSWAIIKAGPESKHAPNILAAIAYIRSAEFMVLRLEERLDEMEREQARP